MYTNKLIYIFFFSSLGDPKAIQRCIVSGFFCNAARLHYTGCYRCLFVFTGA